MSSPNPFDGAEIISSYSRAQAIEDGILFNLNQRPTAEEPELDDVDKIMREAGIRFPAAITATAINQWLIPDDQDRQCGQSFEGRLWDMLTIFKIHARSNPRSEIRFYFIVWTHGQQRHAHLKAICGPGDNAEPVLTFMLPDED